MSAPLLDTHLDNIRSAVLLVLTKNGWTAYAGGPALATKSFDSAVGPKEAVAWFPLRLRSDQLDITLSGVYYSEGCNILSAKSALIPVGATVEQATSLANVFCEAVEAAVGDSYAVRLLRFGA